ncbi:MAG: CheB methylesterase domain-containing protein [Rhodocyclaceae bacterium]|jgi:two-component system chemotaxis response regulator CheB|nr:CheB methylesterase domain-containing protein [Rhodocyclaceae bacterium]
MNPALRAPPRALIFLGASTGGTEAIKVVLQALPASTPPVLIVQHMPEMFTDAFARRLDGLSAMHVKQADDGEAVLGGTVYVAPGHSHLSIVRGPSGYACRLRKEPPVNRHRPSVDVLFESAAAHVGVPMVGVLLTGMGKDGAGGLLAMRKKGAWTIAQDEASCVVFGMPREAIRLGAACEVVSLDQVASAIARRVGELRPVGSVPTPGA